MGKMVFDKKGGIWGMSLWKWENEESSLKMKKKGGIGMV